MLPYAFNYQAITCYTIAVLFFFNCIIKLIDHGIELQVDQGDHLSQLWTHIKLPPVNDATTTNSNFISERT